jgi:hypothetical protein
MQKYDLHSVAFPTLSEAEMASLGTCTGSQDAIRTATWGLMDGIDSAARSAR